MQVFSDFVFSAIFAIDADLYLMQIRWLLLRSLQCTLFLPMALLLLIEL